MILFIYLFIFKYFTLSLLTPFFLQENKTGQNLQKEKLP